MGRSRSLVAVQAGMDAEAGAGDAPGKIEIGRRRRDRIATEDGEAGHAAAVERLGEIGECRRTTALDPVGRRDDIDRRAKARVDPVRQRVPFRREGGAGEHQSATLMRRQIGGGRLCEAAGRLGQIGHGQAGTERVGDARQDRGLFERRHGAPRIRLDARERQRRLGHVEAPEPGRIAAALGEGAREADLVRTGPERVGADAQDRLGPVEPRQGPQGAAEGEFGPTLGIRLVDRLVNMPHRLRQGLQQGIDLAGERRRGDAAGHEMQAASALAAHGGKRPAQGALEHVPGGDAVDALGHRARAVGIVEVEDRGLGEHVGRPQAAGMERIALDLDRPSVDGDGVDAAGPAAQGQSRGVAHRYAGQKLLGRADIGHDLFNRLRTAARGERDACSEQPQRLAPGGRGQRWHIEHSLSRSADLIWRSSMKRAPIAA